MIIAIDGNEANIKTRVGVHQYSYELLKSLNENNLSSDNKCEFWIYIKDKPVDDFPKESNYWKYVVIPGKSIWIIRNLLPYLFRSAKADVFFSPSHYLPPISPIPMVCTIHDLGYLEFSGQFRKYDFWQLKYWSAISIFVSKYIIAVSESTKKDIVRHYPFASNKIGVTYHGFENTRFNTKIPSNVVRRTCFKYKISGEYILFLSTLKPSKNIEGLLTAFKGLVQKGRKENLVIAGKKGWLYDQIFQKVKELGIQDRVIFTDYVDEEDKPALIRGSKVFVSPSFWEGFGIHVLEAMACGVPVVVSRTASLPEVVGKAGVYIEDPKNTQEIADKIDKVLSMSKLEYNKLAQEEVIRAGSFSWEKTAEETLETLISVAKKR